MSAKDRDFLCFLIEVIIPNCHLQTFSLPNHFLLKEYIITLSELKDYYFNKLSHQASYAYSPISWKFDAFSYVLIPRGGKDFQWFSLRITHVFGSNNK